MSTDQDTGIAGRLKAARESKGLSIEALARELKSPRAVLEAMERGDWSRLGAPVFAKSLVGRYAERLGVEIDVADIAASLTAPELRSHVNASPFGRLADFSARHAAYLGGTLLVVPAVYTLLSLTATGPVRVRPLDPAPMSAELARPAAQVADSRSTAAEPPVDGVVAEAPAMESTRPEGAATPALEPTPVTVAASLAGASAETPRQIELRFSGDSWIEVFGRNGDVLDRALARDGEARSFPMSDVGRVTIGNVGATEVLLDGSRVNLDPVRAANVARFALSSDGSIEAVAR